MCTRGCACARAARAVRVRVCVLGWALSGGPAPSQPCRSPQPAPGPTPLRLGLFIGVHCGDACGVAVGPWGVLEAETAWRYSAIVQGMGSGLEGRGSGQCFLLAWFSWWSED